MRTDAGRDRAAVLELLTRAERILSIASGLDEEGFLADVVKQDAVIRNFEVMGEAAKRISEATRTTAAAIPWTTLARFRDLLIHGYDIVSPRQVWRTIQDDLPSLVDELRKLAKDHGWR